MNRLSFLIESGMERAELVLNAQSITDKLQKMAEDLAKIEASDIMQMMDSMKENFGADLAQSFEQIASEKLRALTEALRGAKDAIGDQIIRMEASVNGEPVNDMAMGTSTSPETDMDAFGGEEATGDVADAGEEPTLDDMAAVADGAQEAGPEEDEEVDHEEEFDSLFKDDGAAAAGREKRESVEHNGANALRESANPDLLVKQKVAQSFRSGVSIVESIKLAADYFEIDVNDVLDIVKPV